MICGNQGDLFITNNKEDYQRKCKFLESSLILLHLFLEQFFNTGAFFHIKKVNQMETTNNFEMG